jgi:hypothetical protein
MSANTDTMSATPTGITNVGAKDYVAALLDQLKDTFSHCRVRSLAFQGPPCRVQAHDDDAPVILNRFSVADVSSFEVLGPAFRAWGELIGAIIEAPDGVWVLVRPGPTNHPRLLEELRKESYYSSPERYAAFWEGLSPKDRKNIGALPPWEAYPRYFTKGKTRR